MLARDGAAGRRGLEDRMARVESLVGELTALSNPAAQSLTEELLGTVLELHGAGLQRVLEVIETTPGHEALLSRLEEDDMVRNLLLLHGLHPRPLRQRVETALETVRPFMRAHKGGVELLGVDNGVVRLRLEGSCHGCSASTQTMRNAVEKAIYDAAPDVASIAVDGLAPPPSGPPPIDCLTPLPVAPISATPVPKGGEAEPPPAAQLPGQPARTLPPSPSEYEEARERSPSQHPSIALRPVIGG